jgi:CRP-like cAMP-binding protein
MPAEAGEEEWVHPADVAAKKRAEERVKESEAEARALEQENPGAGESEDEDDDDNTDSDFKPVARRASLARRANVAAPSVQIDDAYVPPKWPKGFDEQTQIREGLRHFFLFQELVGNDANCKVLVDAFEMKSFAEGSTLIEQGSEGLEFFVLVSGSCEISVAGQGTVKTCVGGTPDCYFGELALLYNNPRAASVTTTSPVRVGVLDGVAFKHITIMVHKFKESVSGIEDVGGLDVISQAEAQKRRELQKERRQSRRQSRISEKQGRVDDPVEDDLNLLPSEAASEKRKRQQERRKTRRESRLLEIDTIDEEATAAVLPFSASSSSQQQGMSDILHKYSKSLARIFKYYASRHQVTSKDHSFGDVQNQTGLMALNDWSKCIYDFGFGSGLLNKKQKTDIFQKYARPGIQGVRLDPESFARGFADAADLGLQSAETYKRKYPTKESRVEALFVKFGMDDTHVLRYRLKTNTERHAAVPVPNPMEGELPKPSPPAVSNAPLPRAAALRRQPQPKPVKTETQQQPAPLKNKVAGKARPTPPKPSVPLPHKKKKQQKGASVNPVESQDDMSIDLTKLKNESASPAVVSAALSERGQSGWGGPKPSFDVGEDADRSKHKDLTTWQDFDALNLYDMQKAIEIDKEQFGQKFQETFKLNWGGQAIVPPPPRSGIADASGGLMPDFSAFGQKPYSSKNHQSVQSMPAGGMLALKHGSMMPMPLQQQQQSQKFNPFHSGAIPPHVSGSPYMMNPGVNYVPQQYHSHDNSNPYGQQHMIPYGQKDGGSTAPYAVGGFRQGRQYTHQPSPSVHAMHMMNPVPPSFDGYQQQPNVMFDPQQAASSSSSLRPSVSSNSTAALLQAVLQKGSSQSDKDKDRYTFGNNAGYQGSSYAGNPMLQNPYGDGSVGYHHPMHQPYPRNPYGSSSAGYPMQQQYQQPQPMPPQFLNPQQYHGGYAYYGGQMPGSDAGSLTRDRAMQVRDEQMHTTRQKEEQTLKKFTMPPSYYQH